MINLTLQGYSFIKSAILRFSKMADDLLDLHVIWTRESYINSTGHFLFTVGKFSYLQKVGRKNVIEFLRFVKVGA